MSATTGRRRRRIKAITGHGPREGGREGGAGRPPSPPSGSLCRTPRGRSSPSWRATRPVVLFRLGPKRNRWPTGSATTSSSSSSSNGANSSSARPANYGSPATTSRRVSRRRSTPGSWTAARRPAGVADRNTRTADRRPGGRAPAFGFAHERLLADGFRMWRRTGAKMSADIGKQVEARRRRLRRARRPARGRSARSFSICARPRCGSAFSRAATLTSEPNHPRSRRGEAPPAIGAPARPRVRPRRERPVRPAARRRPPRSQSVATIEQAAIERGRPVAD